MAVGERQAVQRPEHLVVPARLSILAAPLPWDNGDGRHIGTSSVELHKVGHRQNGTGYRAVPLMGQHGSLVVHQDELCQRRPLSRLGQHQSSSGGGHHHLVRRHFMTHHPEALARLSHQALSGRGALVHR